MLASIKRFDFQQLLLVLAKARLQKTIFPKQLFAITIDPSREKTRNITDALTSHLKSGFSKSSWADTTKSTSPCDPNSVSSKSHSGNLYFFLSTEVGIKPQFSNYY